MNVLQLPLSPADVLALIAVLVMLALCGVTMWQSRTKA